MSRLKWRGFDAIHGKFVNLTEGTEYESPDVWPWNDSQSRYENTADATGALNGSFSSGDTVEFWLKEAVPTRDIKHREGSDN